MHVDSPPIRPFGPVQLVYLRGDACSCICSRRRLAHPEVQYLVHRACLGIYGPCRIVHYVRPPLPAVTPYVIEIIIPRIPSPVVWRRNGAIYACYIRVSSSNPRISFKTAVENKSGRRGRG